MLVPVVLHTNDQRPLDKFFRYMPHVTRTAVPLERLLDNG